MSWQIKDLAGIGEILRHLKEFALALIRIRSAGEQRRLRCEAQRLKNEEQAERNRDRRIQNLAKLLALAKKYKLGPDQLQILCNTDKLAQLPEQTLNQLPKK